MKYLFIFFLFSFSQNIYSSPLPQLSLSMLEEEEKTMEESLKEERKNLEKKVKEYIVAIDSEKKALLSRKNKKLSAREKWLRVLLAIEKGTLRKIYLPEKNDVICQGDFLFLFVNPNLIETADIDYLFNSISFIESMQSRYLEHSKKDKK